MDVYRLLPAKLLITFEDIHDMLMQQQFWKYKVISYFPEVMRFPVQEVGCSALDSVSMYSASVKRLHLYNCHIIDFDLPNLEELTITILDDNYWHEDVLRATGQGLKKIVVYCCTRTFDLSMIYALIPNVEDMTITHCMMTGIGLPNLHTLRVYSGENLLSSVPASVRHLELRSSTNLDFTTLPNLEVLDIRHDTPVSPNIVYQLPRGCRVYIDLNINPGFADMRVEGIEIIPA